jgi:autotransporter-associated beta strand protein
MTPIISTRWMNSLLRTLLTKRRSQRPRPSHRLLHLESLERRLVPAHFLWTGHSPVSFGWATAVNWLNTTTGLSGVPAAGDDVTLPAGAPKLLTSYNFTDGRVLNSITISGSGYTVLASSGVSIPVGNGGISAVNASGSNTISAPLSINNGDKTFTVSDSAATLVLSGAISGNAGLVKLGDGELTLGGTAANSYTGTTTVNAGQLTLKKSPGITAVNGPLTIGDGSGSDEVVLDNDNQIADSAAIAIQSFALLDLNNFAETIGPLNMTGGEISTGKGKLTLGRDVTINPSFFTATIVGALSLGSASRNFTVGDGAATADMLISAAISGPAGVGICQDRSGRTRPNRRQ